MNLLAALASMVAQDQGGDALFPPQASTNAATSDWIFYFIFWVSAAAFVIICVATLWLAFRYRRSKVGMVPEDSPHHSVSIEVVWSVIPTIFFILMFWYGFEDYMDRRTVPQGREDVLEIQVQGRKWAWTYAYPQGFQVSGDTLNEGPGLHVPVDTPVRLRIESADVLHSFFVPAFRIKMDAVPGRYTWAWFEATETGEFDVYCTEYCGTKHSRMLSKVTVHTQEEYEAWVAENSVDLADLPPAEAGAELYKLNACNACHSLDGTRLVGPSFQGSYGSDREFEDGSTGVVDDNYIRQSILEPQAKIVKGYPPSMVSYAGQLSDEEISWLIEFIKAQDGE